MPYRMVCFTRYRNAIGNDFRITEPVVERNFGLVEINWNSNPVSLPATSLVKKFYIQYVLKTGPC